MHNPDLMNYYQNQSRIDALIGNPSAPALNTSENVSRDRLLRVQKGLGHLLFEVISQIQDEQQRLEIYQWVDALYTITCCEAIDAEAAHE